MVVVSSGMQQVINDGSVSDDVAVTFGGEQLVELGSTSGSLVGSGGVELVESVSPYGDVSVAYGTQVQSGGLLIVAAGAEADEPIVDSGGYILAFDSSSVQDAILQSGAVSISDGIVSFSPQAGVVVTHDAIDGMTVGSGGFAYVLSDGVATNASVSSSSELAIFSGGEVSGATVGRLGLLAVLDGGELRGADVSGEMSVAGAADLYDTSPKGYASGVIVEPTGEYYVRGIGSGAVVAGYEGVDSGGISYDSQIVGGGVQAILPGLSYSGLVVSPDGVASNTVVSSGGVQIADGGMSVSAIVQSGAEIRLDDSGSLLDAQVELGGQILIGPTVFDYNSLNAKVTFDRADDQLTISEFVISAYTLQLAGDYAGIAFTSAVVPDGLLLTAVVACCCEGTAIATPCGERAIETLRVGDAVLTASGRRRPIRWIGHRSYAGRFLATNPDVQPILFRAGSIGAGLPRRDLRVSPYHAMFLDGVLAPAKALVNGDTILQLRSLEQVDYCHIELDSHDVLLAEGAPTESFLDDGNRGQFHNAAEHAALYPDAAAPGERCAPWVDSGAELEAIRRRLADLRQRGEPGAIPARRATSRAKAA